MILRMRWLLYIIVIAAAKPPPLLPGAVEEETGPAGGSAGQPRAPCAPRPSECAACLCPCRLNRGTARASSWAEYHRFGSYPPACPRRTRQSRRQARGPRCMPPLRLAPFPQASTHLRIFAFLPVLHAIGLVYHRCHPRGNKSTIKTAHWLYSPITTPMDPSLGDPSSASAPRSRWRGCSPRRR